MPMFKRASDEERGEREAAQAAAFREEMERHRIRVLRDRVAARGYSAEDGQVERHGGYGVTVHDDGAVSIGSRDLGDYLETRLAGLRGSLESLEAARDRVTAARLVALGVFALAAPKRDRRRVLVLAGPGGFEAAVVVDGSDEVHLRQWVAWLNRQGAGAAAREGLGDGAPRDR